MIEQQLEQVRKDLNQIIAGIWNQGYDFRAGINMNGNSYHSNEEWSDQILALLPDVEEVRKQEREDSIKALENLHEKQRSYTLLDAIAWLKFRRDAAEATGK